MKLRMELGARGYDIVIKRGVLGKAGLLANLQGRVLIVTDDGVPAKYVRQLAGQCGQAEVLALPQGEHHKKVEAWLAVLNRLQALHFTPADLVAAVGGGTVGDVAGFAAASWQRGLPWCNFPTTTLAMLDAAVGGRTGIDLEGSIGTVGVFHQPQLVAIDPDTLKTLPPRHFANGLAEGLKTALAGSPELLEALEGGAAEADIERVIYLSIRCKKNLVEQDEAGSGPRRLLGFGYTLGLPIEQLCGGEGGLLHGECIGIGMLPMLESHTLKRRVKKLMERLGLPTRFPGEKAGLLATLRGGTHLPDGPYGVVRVKTPGQGYTEQISYQEIQLLVEEAY